MALLSRDSVFSTLFLLGVTAIVKTVFTAVTFGMALPAGVFLPSAATGAAFGRAVGLFMAAWQRNFPRAAIFAGCVPSEPCISPSAYAVVGAASALSGVTRMTLSLVCVFFELTGKVDIVLQIMLAVMAAKFTGDFCRRDGIYEAWINIHNCAL